jgi:hypothetical protein
MLSLHGAGLALMGIAFAFMVLYLYRPSASRKGPRLFRDGPLKSFILGPLVGWATIASGIWFLFHRFATKFKARPAPCRLSIAAIGKDIQIREDVYGSDN